MGNYLTVKKPSSETSWNYILVERALCETSGFSALTSQLITNNTYYDPEGTSSHWYKIRFHDSGNDLYSTYSDAFQADKEYYCTPREVASFMGFDNFDDSTTPTRYEVEDIISIICDEIDRITHHAWREVRVTDEYYDVKVEDRYLGWANYPYDYSSRIALYLKHRKIRSFISGTHKIEYWAGSSWVDFVTDYTEGRNSDYWIDYNRGIIYFVNRYPLRIRQNVRVTYDYGETIVPGDIRRAAILLSAAELLQRQDIAIVYPSGTINVLSPQERWEKWAREAKKTLRRRTEILSPRSY